MSSFERQNFSDQLNIDTPEQVALQFSVAGIGSRFVAVLLDHLIQFVTYVVVILVLVVLVNAFSDGHGSSNVANKAADQMDTATKWVIAIFIFLHFCLIWAYFALFEAYWHGQTPGKRVMKLRVIQDSGRQITFFEALARNLLRIVDYLPSFYLAGLITMLCNKRNKRLGDFVAGTIVVHERLDEQPMIVQPGATLLPREVSASWQPSPQQSDPWQQQIPTLFAADAVAKLGPQDLVVIETFFGRALDLSVEMRAMMAGKIAQQMAAKMGVALPEGNPERALESIVYTMRGGGRSF